MDSHRVRSNLTIHSILRAYLLNINCLIIVFVLGLSAFLSFVSILYALGQVTELQLTNYWCELKDLRTIYQHSAKYGLNEGTDEGCWKSKQFTVGYISIHD